MEHIELDGGIVMPILGFGTYQIRGHSAQSIIEEAIDVGYRHIDTAAYYGNEADVGRAVNASGIAREEFFLTTKLMVGGYGAAVRAIEEALERLGTYIDVLLIHWPRGDDLATWRAMEEAYDRGEVRSLGLSSFYGNQFLDIATAARIRPTVNQCETHPFRQQEEARELFAAHGCILESWSPFVEGRGGFFANPTLAEIGEAYGKSVAQVTLRWLIQRGIPAIPKTSHRARMEENFDVFDFQLTDADMQAIATLETGRGQFGW